MAITNNKNNLASGEQLAAANGAAVAPAAGKEAAAGAGVANFSNSERAVSSSKSGR